MLPDGVRKWQDGGRLVSTGSGSVFVRSAPGSGPTVLLLHGFPSSSYDFRGVVERLGDHAWLTLDFLGFGLSDKPRPHRYSLLEQADIVQTVVADAGVGPVVLLAHDMGTSVATELLARDLSGALPFELQRAVLTNERGFMRGFARLFSAQHPLSAEEAEAQWALLAREDGQRILHLLCAYLNERVRFAPRWHGAVRDWPKPLGFLWATGDPVATTEVLAGLRELRPAGEVIELPGIGHYPQIEVPDEFTAGATDLLELS